jgi:hypothetical protein
VNEFPVTVIESANDRITFALGELASDAADLFDGLLSQGAEIPFEVEPADSGTPLPMYEYQPLTADFIRSNVAELRRLSAYGEVADLVGEETAVGFLVGLWDGRSEFTLDRDRLRGAIAAVIESTPANPASGTEAGEVVVPLAGFHMPAEEITLDGVRIVPTSSIPDAPADAVEAAGGDRGYFAIVRSATVTAPGTAVADDLRRMLRTLRLFSKGNVGLGTYGWVRRADGWERFGTGAARVRQGGYRLINDECEAVEAFSKKLTATQARTPAIDWAVSRFDLGCERPSQIEALSDYLLALRGMLEGGGNANVNLGARVAALAADPDLRDSARMTVERGLALERKLMSGAKFTPSKGSQPLEAIAGIESLLRNLLRSVLVGELAGDLRERADEILLSDGLRVGETVRETNQTAEWRLPDPRLPEKSDEQETEVAAGASAPTTIVVEEVDLPKLVADERVEETRERKRREVFMPQGDPAEYQAHTATKTSTDPQTGDWLAADGGVEWPAFAGGRTRRQTTRNRETASALSAKQLFPVPDATDWEVGELRYERKRPRAI